MANVLPSLFVLGAAALAALFLARHRWSPPGKKPQRRAAAGVLALAAGVQSIHFAEEAVTGFHDRLGALFGLPGMPFAGFLAFNLLWLGIWIASIPGLRSGRAAAFFAAWFLAIAGMLNGVLHPLLALAAGTYFPGLVSSPFIGAASAWLCFRLLHASQPREMQSGRGDSATWHGSAADLSERR